MKLFITFLLSFSILFASDGGVIRVQILEKIFSGLSIEEEIVIWTDNKNLLDIFEEHERYKVTQDCQDANFVILENSSDLKPVCLDKNIFVLNYTLLTDLPQSFGALFWKKGRPNIILLEPRIKANSIKVSKELEPYLEERIW